MENLKNPPGNTGCPLCEGQIIWFRNHKTAVEGKCFDRHNTFTLVQTSRPGAVTVPVEGGEGDE